MVTGELLSPLRKPSGPRAAKEYYYDIWILFQLNWNARIDGRITQASAANRQQPLLQLPAELRNQIWEYVLAPHFNPDKPFSIKELDRTSYDEHTAYLAGCTVDLYPPRKGAYPDHAIVLVSRNLYDETLALYKASVDRYYSSVPMRLKQWAYPLGTSISPSAIQKIAAMTDADLTKIRTLVIDCSSLYGKPEMMFRNGAWRASWRASGSRMRHLVLYEPARYPAVIKALEVQGLDTDEYLQRGKKFHSGWKYRCSMDALMFPYQTGDEALAPVRAAAMSRNLTKKILHAVLYFQCYMSGWH